MSPRKRIVRFIQEFTQAKGYPPTVREVADGAGFLSCNTAHYHLRILRYTGCVTWIEDSPRTLRVLQPSLASWADGRIRDIRKAMAS